MNVREFIAGVVKRLAGVYPGQEAKAMAVRLLQHYCGFSSYEHLVEPGRMIDAEQVVKLEDAVKQLEESRPLQYMIGWQEFCGLRIEVEEGVLIPRPETEELVMWAEEFLKEHHFEVRGKSADSHDKNESAKSQDKSERANGQDRSDSAKYQNHNVSSDYNVSSNFHANLNDNKDCNKIRILDAACGSGAIAAAMANKFPKAEVYACDLSQKALEISAKNFRISNCHNAKAFECDLLSDGAVQMILRHIFNEGHIRHEGHEKHERNEGHEKHERNEGHEGHEKHERNEGHEGQEGQEGQEAHEGFDNNLNLENYIDNVERASTSLTDKPGLDMIISNPPYVTNRERSQMRPNVLDYEPAEALFVPDEDPLLFYKALERLARELLAPGGAIFMEINEQLPEETAALFNEPFFSDVEVRKDFNDKPRMIKALKSSRL